MTSGSRLLNSVVKYVACRASLVVARGARDVVIARNSIAFNGFHHANWADGVTVNNAYNATVTDNFLIDNTDVQMIFGGCRGCTVRGNEFRHSPSFSGGSFAALMFSAMVIEGGNFEGTHVSNNRIDCGPYQAVRIRHLLRERSLEHDGGARTRPRRGLAPGRGIHLRQSHLERPDRIEPGSHDQRRHGPQQCRREFRRSLQLEMWIELRDASQQRVQHHPRRSSRSLPRYGSHVRVHQPGLGELHTELVCSMAARWIHRRRGC